MKLKLICLFVCLSVCLFVLALFVESCLFVYLICVCEGVQHET